MREMEQRRVKKKSGLFRSVSSLSTSSRRNQTESENERENNLERIRLSIGRRSVDDFSNHPISVSYKVGCAFLMVIASDFRIEKHRDDDHEEDAPLFNHDISKQHP